MDPIARTRLETLLASLPSGHDRQHLVDRFVGGEVLLGHGATAQDHARVVLDLIEAEGTDLTDLFAELRDRHPERGADIEAVAQVATPLTQLDDDRPTEALDPAALAAALADHKARAAPRKALNLAHRAPAPSAAAPATAPPQPSPPQPAASSAPHPSPPAAPPAPPSRSLFPAWAGVLVGVLLIGGLAWVIASSARP